MIYWIIGSVYVFAVLLACVYLGYEGEDIELSTVALPLALVLIVPFALAESLGQSLKRLKIERDRIKLDPKYQFDKDLKKLIK